jgi:hypothetical protein
VDDRNPSARPLDSRKTGNSVRDQQSESSEPAITQPSISRRDKDVLHYYPHGLCHIRAILAARKIGNPSRRAPNTRRSSLSAAVLRSERHAHASSTSGDCAVLLFVRRRVVDGCSSTARALDTQKPRNVVGDQQSEPSEPAIAQRRISRRHRAIKEYRQRGSHHFHAVLETRHAETASKRPRSPESVPVASETHSDLRSRRQPSALRGTFTRKTRPSTALVT